MRPFFRRNSIRIGFCVLLAFAFIVIEMFWVPYQREKRAEAYLQSLGGRTEWSYRGPAWVPKSMHPRLPLMWSVTQVKFGADDIPASNVPTSRGSEARLSALDALPRIAVLDLGGDDVTDAGLIRLEQLRTLTTLDLSGTKTTVEGRNRLRKVLSHCRIVPEP
ncbi:MAG: hypothetical protein JWP89_2775 [Schlesneria sp.]|nr:hypothetical protein [Schlesneria sp.]